MAVQFDIPIGPSFSAPTQAASAAQARVDAARGRIDSLVGQLAGLQEALATIQQAIAMLQAELAGLVPPDPSEYRRYERRREGTPPNEHTVTVEVFDSARFNAAMSRYQSKVRRIESEIRAKEAELAAKERELSQCEQDLAEAQQDLAQAQADLERALQEDAKALRDARQRYEEAQKRAQEAREQALRAQAEAQKAQEDLQQAAEQAERMNQAAGRLTEAAGSAPALQEAHAELTQAQRDAKAALNNAANALPRLDGDELLPPVTAISARDFLELAPEIESFRTGAHARDSGLLADMAMVAEGAAVNDAQLFQMIGAWKAAGFSPSQIETAMQSMVDAGQVEASALELVAAAGVDAMGQDWDPEMVALAGEIIDVYQDNSLADYPLDVTPAVAAADRLVQELHGLDKEQRSQLMAQILLQGADQPISDLYGDYPTVASRILLGVTINANQQDDDFAASSGVDLVAQSLGDAYARIEAESPAQAQHIVGQLLEPTNFLSNIGISNLDPSPVTNLIAASGNPTMALDAALSLFSTIDNEHVQTWGVADVQVAAAMDLLGDGPDVTRGLIAVLAEDPARRDLAYANIDQLRALVPSGSHPFNVFNLGLEQLEQAEWTVLAATVQAGNLPAGQAFDQIALLQEYTGYDNATMASMLREIYYPDLLDQFIDGAKNIDSSIYALEGDLNGISESEAALARALLMLSVQGDNYATPILPVTLPPGYPTALVDGQELGLAHFATGLDGFFHPRDGSGNLFTQIGTALLGSGNRSYKGLDAVTWQGDLAASLQQTLLSTAGDDDARIADGYGIEMPPEDFFSDMMVMALLQHSDSSETPLLTAEGHDLADVLRFTLEPEGPIAQNSYQLFADAIRLELDPETGNVSNRREFLAANQDPTQDLGLGLYVKDNPVAGADNMVNEMFGGDRADDLMEALFELFFDQIERGYRQETGID